MKRINSIRNLYSKIKKIIKSSTGKRIKVNLKKKILTGDLEECDNLTICILSHKNGTDMIIPYSYILNHYLKL